MGVGKRKRQSERETMCFKQNLLTQQFLFYYYINLEQKKKKLFETPSGMNLLWDQKNDSVNSLSI